MDGKIMDVLGDRVLELGPEAAIPKAAIAISG